MTAEISVAMRKHRGRRGCALALSLCAAVAALVAGASSGHAAGCQHPLAAGSAPLLDGREAQHRAYWTEWSVGPVYRVYINGQILFFSVPQHGLPCRGPACRGKDPGSEIKMPDARADQRWQSEALSVACEAIESEPPSSRLLVDQRLPRRYSPEPPLRPPR